MFDFIFVRIILPLIVILSNILSCDQAALRTLLSVFISVRPSVCLPLLFHYVRLITIDKSDVRVKAQGQSSNIKVTEVKANFAPVWAFPDSKSSLNLQMDTTAQNLK